MYKKTWDKCYASICSINFYDNNNLKIGSGTGFKTGGHLVTNNHVFAAIGASRVELSFVEHDGYSIAISNNISYHSFQQRLVNGLPEHSWDYAILQLNGLGFDGIPDLNLQNSNTVHIGHKIAVLGFQFDQVNLSIKQGILSSRFIRAGVKYLQIDSSINHGNSGGPLIDIETNFVVGIVTRKYTGLTSAFEQLIESLDANITALQPYLAEFYVNIGGINPTEKFVVSQRQIQIATKEIYRSANVGIGYAYELDELFEGFRSI